MVVGAMMTLGGLFFILATLFIRDQNWPIATIIAPAVQVAMGLLAVCAGILAIRENRLGVWLFVLSLLVVLGMVAWLFVTVYSLVVAD